MATQKEIAAHLDLSERRVRVLIEKGVLPPSKGRGGLDFDVCRFAYINYLRGLSSGQVKGGITDGGESDIDTKSLIDKEILRQKKRENDIADGEIANVEHMVNAITQAANQIHPILDGIEPKLKRINPELTSPDLQIVNEQVAKAKNVIANMRLDTSAF